MWRKLYIHHGLIDSAVPLSHENEKDDAFPSGSHAHINMVMLSGLKESAYSNRSACRWSSGFGNPLSPHLSDVATGRPVSDNLPKHMNQILTPAPVIGQVSGCEKVSRVWTCLSAFCHCHVITKCNTMNGLQERQSENVHSYCCVSALSMMTVLTVFAFDLVGPHAIRTSSFLA